MNNKRENYSDLEIRKCNDQKQLQAKNIFANDVENLPQLENKSITHITNWVERKSQITEHHKQPIICRPIHPWGDKDQEEKYSQRMDRWQNTGDIIQLTLVTE